MTRESSRVLAQSLECATAEAAAVLSRGQAKAEGTAPAPGFQVTVPELVPEIDFDPDSLRPLNDPEAEVLAKPTWLRLGLAWSQSAHDDVQRSASRLLSNMACGSQGDLVAQSWLLNIIKDCTDTLPHEHKVRGERARRLQRHQRTAAGRAGGNYKAAGESLL